MIGYCGIDCDQCEAFIATKNNDDALRVKVAEKWAKLENAPILPEHINCTGCRSNGMKTYYCDQLCKIRKCAFKISIDSCSECSDYHCSLLNPIFEMNPQAKKTLDALNVKK